MFMIKNNQLEILPPISIYLNLVSTFENRVGMACPCLEMGLWVEVWSDGLFGVI